METYKRSFHLLCPGPVNVRPEVADALTSFEFCHREEEFSVLLDALQRNILTAAELREPERYAAVVITGSGTAANETVLSSVIADDERVLVLTNGEFGERLAHTASLYHAERAERLEHTWAAELDLDALRARLERGDLAWVAMVHHETSTGMLNPVEAVGVLCHAHGVQLFVDGVSSFTADALDLEAGHVTFLSSSSGKAIGCYPGLSVVIGRRDAFEALRGRTPRTQYLDLWRYYDFLVSRMQTPNTPAVPLFLSLNAAFELAVEEGMEARRARMGALADHVREAGRALGLELLIPEHRCSNVVSSFRLPDGVPFHALRTHMRARGFVIYGGKGPLSDTIFQVSTISDVSPAILDAFFDALGASLSEIRGRIPSAA